MSDTTHNARRASVRLTINGHDATDYMAPSLLDFSYTDNLSGKADEVQISLQDREARWNGPWKPQKGMKVEASLTVKDWFAPGENATLNCGSFKIDEVTLDGPPDVFKIKAVSASLTSGLREEAKTRAWENQSLKGVAGQIAQEHGLELMYEGEDAPLSRQDQREEADLPFVNRLANERAMHCKVHDNKLILSDSIKAEQKKTSLTLSRVGGDCPVTRYSFKQASAGTDYTKAESAYTDPSTGQVHTATATVPPPSEMVGPPDEKTMLINARMESAAEAMRLAGSSLHNANKSKDTASVDCMGHPGLVAGLTVNLAGFGDFSGAYLIEKATHKVGGSGGYTTALDLRKCRLAPDVRMSSGSRAVAQNIPVKKPRPDLDPGPAPALPVNPTEKWATLFDMYRQFWLASNVDKLTKLLLCLPEIAQSMAGKAGNADDAKGWLYLESMFHHWFSGKANRQTMEDPYWVDFWWVMQFPRAALERTMLVSEDILNDAAKHQLGLILQREGFLSGESATFDFTTFEWPKWERYYHQHRAVPRGKKPDGLQAAMGSFTLRALAAGHTMRQRDGKYRIEVTKLSIYVHDRFNFEGDDDFYYWDCASGSFLGPLGDPSQHVTNGSFNAFRQNTGRGGDFLVLSQLVPVETFMEKIYVWP